MAVQALVRTAIETSSWHTLRMYSYCRTFQMRCLEGKMC
jgi:hypothetical protein